MRIFAPEKVPAGKKVFLVDFRCCFSVSHYFFLVLIAFGAKADEAEPVVALKRSGTGTGTARSERAMRTHLQVACGSHGTASTSGRRLAGWRSPAFRVQGSLARRGASGAPKASGTSHRKTMRRASVRQTCESLFSGAELVDFESKGELPLSVSRPSRTLSHSLSLYFFFFFSDAPHPPPPSPRSKQRRRRQQARPGRRSTSRCT